MKYSGSLCSMHTAKSKLTEREIAQAWAKITIIKWKKKLDINKVGNSGTLLQSFQYNVLASAQGNVLKITLLFEYYIVALSIWESAKA
jgi:hypothetical protein